LEREADRLAATGVGGRNHTTNKASFTLAGHAPVLSMDEMYDALYAACVTNGYITSRDPSDGPRQFKRTFMSGWRDGLARALAGPRDVDLRAALALVWGEERHSRGDETEGEHSMTDVDVDIARDEWCERVRELAIEVCAGRLTPDQAFDLAKDACDVFARVCNARRKERRRTPDRKSGR
jgi:hypothetical protein